MRFVLLAEGATEKRALARFLKRWLDPKLKAPVRIDVVNLRGGDKFVKDVKAKAAEHLGSPKSGEIIAVIGLMDLYRGAGVQSFYPPELASASERFDWAKQQIEREVGDARFRMFLAVHETEAWLLSVPEIFRRPLPQALQKHTVRPEAVNFDNPPAKLLNELYRKHLNQNYKKVTYGTQLFDKLDPAAAAAKCPHLKQLLDEMLQLAKTAGL